MTCFRAHRELLSPVGLLDSIPDVVRGFLFHAGYSTLDIEHRTSKIECSMFDAQRKGSTSYFCIHAYDSGLRAIRVYANLRGTYADAYSFYLE